jgi:hypothetical protein
MICIYLSMGRSGCALIAFMARCQLWRSTAPLSGQAICAQRKRWRIGYGLATPECMKQWALKLIRILRALGSLPETQEFMMEKIDELEVAVGALEKVVPAIAEDYQSMIKLVADLQAKLEASTKPDAALQQRISDVTTRAMKTLNALQTLADSYPNTTPAAATPEQQQTEQQTEPATPAKRARKTATPEA